MNILDSSGMMSEVNGTFFLRCILGLGEIHIKENFRHVCTETEFVELYLCKIFKKCDVFFFFFLLDLVSENLNV